MSKRRTILHISSASGAGGAETMVSCLAASIDSERFRSVMCLFRPGWLLEQCSHLGLPAHLIPLRSTFDWKWVSACLQLIWRERVDLIHAHEFGANVYGLLLATLANIPIIATIHGKSYYCDTWWRRLAYRAVGRFATMIAVSKDLKSYIIANLGISENSVKVIYNGINVQEASRVTATESKKASLQLPCKSRIIGTVGSLYPVKGHIYLIEALPSIIERFADVKLLVIGTGELEMSLKAQANALGLEEHVRFLGFRSDVPELLPIMDVFVLPSLSEGLSLALLEAMAATKPIVATSVGGNPEAIVDGVTGLLVDPRDPKALANRIISILGDRIQAEQLGVRGRERAVQHFSIERMVDEYQQLYEQLT